MSKQISIYVHFPFCEQKCRYCDFYSITDETKKLDFIEQLCRELYLSQSKFGDYKNVNTIFFGGGTPSTFSARKLEKVINRIASYYNISECTEFTIECNPGTIDLEKLRDYKSLGINRLSLGVQSLNENTLRFLGRIHTANQSMEIIKIAQKAGFDNLSIDMIFSVPGQSINSYVSDLKYIVELDAPHISTYNLTYETGTPLHNDLINQKFKPQSQDDDAEFYLRTIDLLGNFGYEHYEISNFAKPGFSCKHNLNYWIGGSYLGFGPAAHSYFENTRTANIANLNKYLSYLKNNELPVDFVENLSYKDIIYEKILLGLRCEGVDNKEFINNYNINLFDIIKYFYNGNIEKYFLYKYDIIRLTKEGKLYCDEITSRIFSLLDDKIEK